MSMIYFNIIHKTMTSEIFDAYSRHNPNLKLIEKYNPYCCVGVEERVKLWCGQVG